ncbi:MAG: hypothetical protein J6U54_02200 [Clostridiales bacterium]|nr:hypothetical protein [Clostridiales bacterium]
MSDFVSFEEDIENGMEYLSHFGILGQKHGKRNGPPYPLGSGDHSSAEKKAAADAGVKVGQDSGKGSIDNVKKPKPKKPLTEEEKRERAIEAYKKGDKRKITKYMETMSTDELADAKRRVELREALDKKDDKSKQDAINSGDIEKVRAIASKLTATELEEAMKKVSLTEKLNHVDPPPTVMDRIQSVSEKLGTFKAGAEKTIEAYNVVATVMNSINKDGDSKWPIIDKSNNTVVKTITEDVSREVKETAKQKYEREAREELDKKKAYYKAEREFEDYVAKEAAKRDKKNKGNDSDAKDNSDKNTTSEGAAQNDSKSESPNKPSLREALAARNLKAERAPALNTDHEYIKKEGEGEDAKYYYKSETPPNVTKATFNTKISGSDIDYDDVVPDSAKQVMNQARMDRVNAELDFDDLYDYAMRHSEV